jgi:CBS domain-containing protein
MAEKRVRRLIVLNRAKRLVGVVSLGDLATAPGSQQAAGHALQTISKPAL